MARTFEQFGFLVRTHSKLSRWLKRNHYRLLGIVRRKHKASPAPKPLPAPNPAPAPKPTPSPLRIEMYDDINVGTIPVTAEAVAGYVDGKWPTAKELTHSRFPRARHFVSIAVFASDDANVLDIEPGDATIAQAASWIKRQHARGEHKPGVYTSVAQAEKLINALASAGFTFGKDYVLWTAHYNGVPHLCGPKCGFGFTHVAHATQWTDKAGGKSLDESLVAAEFFGF